MSSIKGVNVECEGGMRACGALVIFHLLGDDDGGYVRLWSSSSLLPVNARNTPRCLWRSDKPVYSKALSIMPLIYASYIYIYIYICLLYTGEEGGKGDDGRSRMDFCFRAIEVNVRPWRSA